MKMKFSYKDNWIWQRLNLGTCPRQVTSHCIQIGYLQSTRTTMYAFSERNYFFRLFREVSFFTRSGGALKIGGGIRYFV